MWQLDNRTPFAAERTWVRDRDGTEIWLVAVRATFEVQADGGTRVADEQPPVTAMAVHAGKPGASSVLLESDLQRTKTTTDIVLNGCAHAPHGQAVSELTVGLAVGALVKTLKVFGDRRWDGKRIGAADAFVKMPLVYERAYGGVDLRAGPGAWDARNPVGRGYFARAEHAHGQLLPNIEDPKQLIRAWDDRPTPAGFGPLASHWQERQRWSGTYDARWERERLPLLPVDFDDRYHQCAQPDQQTPQFLRGGEPVALINLSPSGRDVRFVLPRMHLGLETSFYTGPSVRHPPPRLHTVILEPEMARVGLVWHSALPCHSRVLKLQRTRIVLKEDLRDGVLAPATTAELEP